MRIHQAHIFWANWYLSYLLKAHFFFEFSHFIRILNQNKPKQTKTNQTKPNQTQTKLKLKPKQTKPNQTQTKLKLKPNSNQTNPTFSHFIRILNQTKTNQNKAVNKTKQNHIHHPRVGMPDGKGGRGTFHFSFIFKKSWFKSQHSVRGVTMLQHFTDFNHSQK